MADDPYQVLGVARSASDDDIRRAYLKLVKELHPDVNPSRTAEDRFKKVSAAYDIVGDGEKRRRFDRGEIDANGEPKRYSARSGAGGGGRAGFGGFDSDDIFSDIFGAFRDGASRGAGARTGPRRGQDARYTLEVDFLEAVQGAKKRVTMPEGGVLDLTVPEGVADGQVLRLKGKGLAGVSSAEAGDALVEIKVRAHSQFTRVGDDIHLDWPIAIDDAVLGAKIEVPTASGRVNLTLPKGTSSGQVFRLRGKGVRSAQAGTQGDQLVTVKIVLPDEIDETLAVFFTNWRLTNKYDPARKG